MLDTLNELDSYLKEKSTAVKTYTLTQEEKSTSELTESLSRQESTSDVDLEQFSEEVRDIVRMILTPFSELKTVNLVRPKALSTKLHRRKAQSPFEPTLSNKILSMTGRAEICGRHA